MKRSSVALLVLSAVYLLAAIYQLPLVREQINPDGISYLSIAQRYLSLDFSGALNGHWGPMFSWLLMPLLALRVEPLLACKIQTFATGLATLGGAWCLTSRYTKLLALRIAVCAALVPMLIAWASDVVSPDLLVLCFLTFYAFFISDPASSPRSIILAAIFGALTYLAKSYGFVFFLAHFTLVCAARQIGLRKFALGMAVFLALSLPWAGALSLKYGKPTFGTAAAYNLGLVGPSNGPVGSQVHPVQTQGLLAPPDEQAVSAWDDPTYLHFPPWPSFQQSARRIRELVLENIFALFDALQAASILAWPIVGAALLFPLLPSLRSEKSRLLFATVASAALYTAGYLPLLIETRYIWILPLLLLMLAAGLLDLMAERFQLVAAILALLIAATFLVKPLASMPRPGKMERDSAEIARALAANGIDLRGRRLASDDEWAESLYLAYFAHAQYFGTVLRERPDEVRAELDHHCIDSFLILNHQVTPPAYLDGFHQVIVRGAETRFALYQRD